MKTVKTPKGTELPLMSIKGKDYLQVAHRIVWFREEKPNWTIETECISTSPEASLFRATVKDESGRIIAMAHKSETVKGFPDHLEKAETGSIGRCLGFCGFGTQFTPELDEGERLVDSPLPKKEAKPIEEQKVAPERTVGGLTLNQLKRLDAIAHSKQVSPQALKNMAEGMGIKSRNEMTRDQYEKLVTLVENYKV